MKWYINASETEQEIFREWLYGVMCMHEVEIDFIKKKWGGAYHNMHLG